MTTGEEFELTENEQLTAQAILDELRTQDRARAAKRLEDLEEISPVCVRQNLRKTVTCGHKLNRHDPCSMCPCPGFRSAEGEDADAASARLMAEHPDLFPKTDE